MSRATRAHRRVHPPATVSVRPIGPDQIEVRTACRHAAYRTGYQLGEVVTERVAVAASIAHHHAMQTCFCMKALWPRYRTEASPADLDAMRDRFNTLWSRVEAQQRQRGFAVLDWEQAVREVAGETSSLSEEVRP